MKYIHKFLSHKDKYKLELPEDKLYQQVDVSTHNTESRWNRNKIASESEFNDSFNKISNFIKNENLNKRCYVEDDNYLIYFQNFVGLDETTKIIIVDNKSFGKEHRGVYLKILPLTDEWYFCKLQGKATQKSKATEWNFECDSIEGVFQLIVDFKNQY